MNRLDFCINVSMLECRNLLQSNLILWMKYMIVDEEILVFQCLDECWDILETLRSSLQWLNFINDYLKGVLFPSISYNKLSFFEILVVAYINDELLESILGTKDLTTEDCTSILTSTIYLNIGAELCLYLWHLTHQC